MVEQCILGMESSSARRPIVPLASVRVQPGKANLVKVHVEPTLERDPVAIQGENI